MILKLFWVPLFVISVSDEQECLRFILVDFSFDKKFNFDILLLPPDGVINLTIKFKIP